MSDYTVTVEVVDRYRVSSAELCRMNGWGPGTLLVGDEGYGPTVIKITAVGEENVLAKTISHKGQPRTASENNWSLHAREWREVAE